MGRKYACPLGFVSFVLCSLHCGEVNGSLYENYMFHSIKRIVSLLLVVHGCVFTALADNRLTLSEISGTPGAEVSVSVAFTNTDPVSALQLTLPLGKHLRYVDGSCALSATRSNGHTLTASQVDDELRIYIYSLNLSPLSGNTGELLSFRLLLGKEPADYALLPDAVLSDATGATISASIMAGQVTILAPKLQILTPEIDYGHIPIRATYPQSLSLQNVGNLPLIINDIITTDPLFTPETTTLTIAPRSIADIAIAYAPVTRGKTSAQLSVASDAINGVQRAILLADPFSVNELHVGAASGIADSLVTIPLTMNNMEPIVAMQCAFRLPQELLFDAGSFSVNANRTNGHIALSLVHGDTLSLYIYSPTNRPLLSDDGEVASFRLRLNGNSGTYYLTPIDVILSNATSENMVSATFDGEVSIQSPRLDCDDRLAFADAPIIDTAYTALAVRNYGDAPLVIERATFLAEGYSVADTLPVSVSPWGETTLTVAYQPEAEGDFSTTMNLYTNDPTARLKPIALSGHIYEPNSLSVEGQSWQGDDAYTLSVSLSNYTDIVAAQFDVHWIGTMATSQAQCTPSPRLQQHNYSVSRIGDSDYRVLMYSMANTPISGHDGELLQLLFTSQESSITDYCGTTLAIDNIVLSNARGENKQSQSALTYHVEQPRYTTDIAVACDKYVFDNKTYTESGIYIDTLQTVHGCDSVVTLHLTVNHSVATEFSATACDSYMWNNKEYTISGDYVETLQTVHGCDSVVTLHLIVNNSAATEFSATACDSYMWNDKEYTTSGDYVETLQTAHGCDSVVTLHLIVNNSAATEFSTTACDSYVWNNKEYTTSGDYVETLHTAHGCDSVVTLHLIVNNSAATEFSATACDSYVWNNKEYTTSGDYVETLQTAHGCDSVVTLHLTVNESVTIDTTIVAMDSLLWENTMLRESGDYVYQFKTIHGCDSIVALHLTIWNTPTALCAHMVNPYTIYPNPAIDVVYLRGDDIVSVWVFSSAGSLVYDTRLTGSQTEHAIDVHKLAAGVYMVVVYDTHHTAHTTTFIKSE